jgi:DNA polymerase III subunit alpha
MYTHLHVHSTFSDGLATPAQLIAAARARGQAALALTDHNTVGGHVLFRTAAAEHGITPILGAELRVRSAHGRGHVLVLCGDAASYTHLSTLLGPKPRRGGIALGDLVACGPGLYVTSACRGGLIASAVDRADYFTARDTAREFANAFPGRYYLEVQPTFGAILPWICALGRELDLPILATNDVHYLDPADATRHGAPGLDLATGEAMRLRGVHAAYHAALEVTGALADHLTRASQRWQDHENHRAERPVA